MKRAMRLRCQPDITLSPVTRGDISGAAERALRLAAQLAAEQEYAAAKPDPIAAFAGPVCGHMNDDHSDSTRVLVQHFVGVEVD